MFLGALLILVVLLTACGPKAVAIPAAEPPLAAVTPASDDAGPTVFVFLPDEVFEQEDAYAVSTMFVTAAVAEDAFPVLGGPLNDLAALAVASFIVWLASPSGSAAMVQGIEGVIDYIATIYPKATFVIMTKSVAYALNSYLAGQVAQVTASKIKITVQAGDVSVSATCLNSDHGSAEVWFNFYRGSNQIVQKSWRGTMPCSIQNIINGLSFIMRNWGKQIVQEIGRDIPLLHQLLKILGFYEPEETLQRWIVGR